jgi:hypothetical protein
MPESRLKSLRSLFVKLSMKAMKIQVERGLLPVCAGYAQEREGGRRGAREQTEMSLHH